MRVFLIAFIIMATVAAASAAPAARMTEACRLIYPQVGTSKSILWSGVNGTRAVVLGLGGDRVECLFAEGGGDVPSLATLQVVAPGGGVSAYAGKRLAEWNKLIGEHFSAAR
jgi:hypothetical protein